MSKEPIPVGDWSSFYLRGYHPPSKVILLTYSAIVPRGKGEKNSGKRVKRSEIQCRQSVEGNCHLGQCMSEGQDWLSYILNCLQRTFCIMGQRVNLYSKLKL